MDKYPSLKNKNIVYIVHTYSDFQKSPIDEIAKYFNKVYVIVRYKPISKIAKFLPFKWLKKYDDSYVIDMTNVPENVEVLKSTVWYLPYGFLYKLAGWLHFKSVDNVIKENKIEFDIIHAHFIWTAGYVGMKLKEKYKKPVVVTGHGFDVYDLPFQSDFWRRITLRILKNVDLVLTVSKKNLKSLYKLGMPKSEVEILENGYDSRLFFPIDKNIVRKKLGINFEGKILVAVGSLEEIKGHKYLVEAIASLNNKFKNLRCYIVGGGAKESELKTQIEKLKLEEKVYLVGHVSHEKINDWINACDIFVMSSLNEGMPIVMLEALGCGKPFVGTKVGGIPEIICSEDLGLLTKRKDSNELAQTLEKALDKKWKKDIILKHGKRFTILKQIEKTSDVYVRLLQKYE